MQPGVSRNTKLWPYLAFTGDHLYRMDYREFVKKHRETKADITIAALPCDEKRASAFGLMKIDGSGQVIHACINELM